MHCLDAVHIALERAIEIETPSGYWMELHRFPTDWPS